MIRLGCENYKKEASEFANPKKRPKFILLIRKINKKIKKRQKIVKQLEEEEQSGGKNKIKNKARSRSVSGDKTQSDMQFSGGSETSSFRKTKQYA